MTRPKSLITRTLQAVTLMLCVLSYNSGNSVEDLATLMRLAAKSPSHYLVSVKFQSVEVNHLVAIPLMVGFLAHRNVIECSIVFNFQVTKS